MCYSAPTSASRYEHDSIHHIFVTNFVAIAIAPSTCVGHSVASNSGKKLEPARGLRRIRLSGRLKTQKPADGFWIGRTRGSTATENYWSVSRKQRPAISACSTSPLPRCAGDKRLLFAYNNQVEAETQFRAPNCRSNLPDSCCPCSRSTVRATTKTTPQLCGL